jgi:hypothetical protein
MVIVLSDLDGDEPAALGWKMRPLLAAAADVILASGDAAEESLMHVADERRLGVLIATTAARRAE